MEKKEGFDVGNEVCRLVGWMGAWEDPKGYFGISIEFLSSSLTGVKTDCLCSHQKELLTLVNHLFLDQTLVS